MLQIARELARRRCDVILAGDALVYVFVAPLAALFRRPVVVFVMGLDLTFANRPYRALVTYLLPRARRVLAISRATATVASRLGVPEDRLAVIRLAVGAPDVRESDRATAATELRRWLELPSDAVTVLTVGRLVERKGQRWFVEEVLPSMPERVVYVIAGDGEERADIERRAVELGISRRVRLLGPVDEPTRELLLLGADCFVQPNVPVEGDIEGFGLVTVEAAQRGLPVVASALEGLQDAVVPGVTGELVPPRDASAWIDTLGPLLADPRSLADTGARYGAEARRVFSRSQFRDSLVFELSQAAPG